MALMRNAVYGRTYAITKCGRRLAHLSKLCWKTMYHGNVNKLELHTEQD